MKKLLLFASVVASFGIASAQQWVSTQPSARHAVLEEFTGVNCTYCPEGHMIANQILRDNPARAHVINVHQGGFSPTSYGYNTDEGDALGYRFSISSYPTAIVNRQQGAISRDSWYAWCSTIMSQISYVNVAGRARLATKTRTLTIDMETYYTSAAGTSEQTLAIAVLQDGLTSAQSGASYNPAQVLPGGQYLHLHMLRDYVTSVWGEPIEETSAGSLNEMQFEYVIPEQYSGNPAPMHNLSLVALVCDGNGEVITACNVPIEISDAPYIVKAQQAVPLSSEPVANIEAEIYNGGEIAITSATLSYSIEGGTAEEWTAEGLNIAPGESTIVTLPDIELASGSEKSAKVSIVGFNGETATYEQEFSVSLAKNVTPAGVGNLTLYLVLDQFGAEVSYKFYGPDGAVLKEGSDYPNLPKEGTQMFTEELPVTIEGDYALEILDAGGNGINRGYGTGTIVLDDSRGVTLINHNGQFGDRLTFTLPVSTGTGIEPLLDGTDAAPSEYYNLQGIRIEKPQSGLYIEKRGNDVRKKYRK